MLRAFGFPEPPASASTALVNLTLAERGLQVRYLDLVYWTLCVEAYFYVFAWVLLVTGAVKERLLPYVLGTWVGLEVIWYVVGADGSRLGWGMGQALSLSFAHMFAAGMAVYEMTRTRRAHPVHIALVIAAPGVHWLAFGGLRGAMAVAFCQVIFLLAVTGRLRFLAWKPLAALAIITYPLYALHRIVGLVALRTLTESGLPLGAAVPVVVVLVTAIAWFVTVTLELPVLRLIRSAYTERTERRSPPPP